MGLWLGKGTHPKAHYPQAESTPRPQLRPRPNCPAWPQSHEIARLQSPLVFYTSAWSEPVGRQVLGVVELRPVALIPELPD